MRVDLAHARGEGVVGGPAVAAAGQQHERDDGGGDPGGPDQPAPARARRPGAGPADPRARAVPGARARRPARPAAARVADGAAGATPLRPVAASSGLTAHGNDGIRSGCARCCRAGCQPGDPRGRRCATVRERDERPVHPVARGLRARGQRLGGLPAAAPGHRGLAGAHRAVLQPHRLRRVARAGVRRAGASRRSSRASPTAACSAAATPSCRATWARPTSGTPSSGRGAGAAANPAAVYCCDPVIGDVGRGVFVRPGIPELLRDVAVPGRRRRHPQPLRARPARRDDDPSLA